MIFLKNMGLILAVSLTFSSMMYMIYLNPTKISGLIEFSKPLTIFLLALSFLTVFILKHSNIYNYIINLVGFSLISIHYFLGIFLLAISTDNMVIQMVEKKPFQSRSIFSPQVTMGAFQSLTASREGILTYFVVMFSIMSTMSASAYFSLLPPEIYGRNSQVYFMMEKKKTCTARTMQLVV